MTPKNCIIPKVKISKLGLSWYNFSKMNNLFWNCDFYLGFLSQIFPNYRTAGEGEGHFLNSTLPLPLVSHTLRHNCRELKYAKSWWLESNQNPLVSELKSLKSPQKSTRIHFSEFHQISQAISLDTFIAKFRLSLRKYVSFQEWFHGN